MIIIDEHADNKLIKALEELRGQPNINAIRYIHFKLSVLPHKNVTDLAVRRKIIASAQKYIAATIPQIYLCEDGDIIILAPSIPTKDGKLLILEVAEQFQLPLSEDFAGLYELAPNINKLLISLEKKIESRRQAEEALKKQQEIAQAARKRQQILNTGVPENKAHNISQRRNSRDKAEFMIIEDDVFSRRLVENVLQKQYSLTALGGADMALPTYANIAPDLLFLDINLPDVNGHELLQKIIAVDPDAYIIMLSGNSDQANIMQAMKNGAKGFIAKPFTRDKLFQYIERCPTINH